MGPCSWHPFVLSIVPDGRSAVDGPGDAQRPWGRPQAGLIYSYLTLEHTPTLLVDVVTTNAYAALLRTEER